MSKERDMTEENKAAEAAEDQTVGDQAEPETEPEAPDNAPQVDPEIEERARRMGWAPQDEFKGDPKRWVDAETFVQRGEEIMPILKANLRQFERDNAELKKTLSDLTDHLQRADARAYQRALKDIKDQQRKAAESGDVETYDRLEREAQGVLKEAAQERRQPRQEGGQDVHPDALAWREENPWFTRDEEMATFAAAQHELLLQTKPGLTMKENLAEVTRAVKKAYPEKFTNPRRNTTQAVEGNPGTRRGGNGKSYDALPPDAKAACDRLVKQGVLKREDYVKDYFSE